MAIKLFDIALRKDACEARVASLEENEVYELLDRPVDKKVATSQKEEGSEWEGGE